MNSISFHLVLIFLRYITLHNNFRKINFGNMEKHMYICFVQMSKEKQEIGFNWKPLCSPQINLLKLNFEANFSFLHLNLSRSVAYFFTFCEELDTTEQLHFHFSLSCIGEGNGDPLQCSCLENPRDRGAWWAARLWGCTESDTTEVT